jgi:glycerol-3-phosphate dehydrogenase (NAD(P)+)
MKIAVLGAGAWGTAIAISLSRRHSVALWARSSQQSSAMRLERLNKRYLPDHAFPRELEITDGITSAVEGAHLTLVAVAIAGLRETLQRLKATGCTSRIVWLCKGFDI